MRKIGLFLCFLVSLYSFAQLGVNNNDPKATLDIDGKSADIYVADGVKAPVMSLDQLILKKSLYNDSQKGVIVYINNIVTTSPDASSTPFKFISLPGYYYYNGHDWKSLEPRSGAVLFTAELGKGSQADGNAAHDSIYVGQLQAVKLIEQVNIGGNANSWNPNTYEYTIPVTGTYLLGGSIRRTDDNFDNTIIYLKIGDISTRETSDGIWVSNRPGGRFTIPLLRIAYLQKGDKVNLCMLTNRSPFMTLLYASLSITLLNQMEN